MEMAWGGRPSLGCNLNFSSSPFLSCLSFIYLRIGQEVEEEEEEEAEKEPRPTQPPSLPPFFNIPICTAKLSFFPIASQGGSNSHIITESRMES